jgi:hypothetical protein
VPLGLLLQLAQRLPGPQPGGFCFCFDTVNPFSKLLSFISGGGETANIFVVVLEFFFCLLHGFSSSFFGLSGLYLSLPRFL